VRLRVFLAGIPIVLLLGTIKDFSQSLPLFKSLFGFDPCVIRPLDVGVVKIDDLINADSALLTLLAPMLTVRLWYRGGRGPGESTGEEATDASHSMSLSKSPINPIGEK
jgi:hypothetical protein